MYCLVCDRKINNKKINKFNVCTKCLIQINSLKINYTYLLNLKNNIFFKENYKCKVIFKYSGIIKDLIYRYKFKKELKLSNLLVKLIIDEIDINLYKKNNYLISPAPTHILRLLKTGFLPNNYLAYLISKKLKLNYCEYLKKKYFL